MSEFVIKDGTGKGYRSAVDSGNRLRVHAVAQVESASFTNSGDGYVIPMSKRTFNTTATQYPIMYINPNSPSKAFAVNRFYGSWSGPDVAIYRIYYGASAPTAGHVPFPAPNSNSNSVRAAALTLNVWNGVSGTGMTVASNGTEALTTYVTTGPNDIMVAGTLLWGFGVGALITVEAPVSAGSGTLLISGWEIDV